MTENELLAELARELSLPEIDTSIEITAQMLAHRLNMGERNALSILRKREQAGELISRYVRSENGRKILAFRKPGP